ncbi:MAG: mechanosensitive ion channel family protein [Thermoplasmata archaeon]
MKNSKWVRYFIGVLLTIILGSATIFAINILLTLPGIKSSLKAINISISILNTVVIVLILSLMAYLITKFIGKTVYYYATKKIGENDSKRLKTLIEITVFSILIFIILFTVGVNITVALLSAGFLGIVLGIAAQQVLSNIFAGFYILFSRPFKIGDTITVVTWQYGLVGATYPHENIVPGYRGRVEELGFLYTKILNDENLIISIPNSIIIQAMVYNHTVSKSKIARTRIDIPTSIPVDNFKEKMIEKLKEENILNNGIGLDIKVLAVSKDYYNVVVLVTTTSSNPEITNDIVLRKALEIING